MRPKTKDHFNFFNLKPDASNYKFIKVSFQNPVRLPCR